jgi:hypothetical protein
MPIGKVGGGITPRWWCNNPRCPDPWHYSSWCTYREPTSTSFVPLSPEQLKELAEQQLERRRQAERDVARARRVRAYTSDPNDPVLDRARRRAGHWWLREFFLVLVVFAVALLVLVLAAH